MITENYKYESGTRRSVEYDKFHCHKLGRIVDLGFDERIPKVHDWISSLNKVNAKIYTSTQKVTEKIQLNQNTFDLLFIAGHPNYNYDNNKIGVYSIEIVKDINNNLINFISDNSVKGQINIIK